MSADLYVGQIIWAAFSQVPTNLTNDLLHCDGRLLSIQAYPDLYDAIQDQFGGSGAYFALPDLRGRTPIGQGDGPSGGGNYRVGDKGGAETVTLTIDQVPPHDHVLLATSQPGTGAYPGNIIASAGANKTNLPYSIYASAQGDGVVALAPGNIGVFGAGGAHTNMQPFLTLNAFIIAHGIRAPRPALHPDQSGKA